MKPPPEATWRAGKDEIGHALVKGQLQSRYLCGGMPIAERFAWPVQSKHEACVAELNRLTNAALMTEGESRVAWGNR